MDSPDGSILVFDDFLLDIRRRLLFNKSSNAPISISPKSLDLLILLASEPQRLWAKDELVASLWPNVIVEDSNLKQCISALRRTLGESPGQHRFIVTEPGRGYRFVAEVGCKSEETPAVVCANQAPFWHFSFIQRWQKHKRVSYLSYFALAFLMAIAVSWQVIKRDDKGDKRFVGLVDVSEPVPGFSGRAAIAVLPFENLSNDSSQEYFVDGLTQDFQTGLESYRIFPIIADSTMFRYKGSTNMREIAAQVGAGYLIAGGVKKELGSDAIKIYVRLINRLGQQMWAQSYQLLLTDTFDIQREVLARILHEIEPELIVSEASNASRMQTSDMEAHDFYLRAITNTLPVFALTDLNGREVTLERIELARQFALEAIKRDPNFAAGYRALNHVEGTTLFAFAHTLSADEKKEVLARGIEYGERARQLDPFEPTVCSCLAMMLFAQGNVERAYLLQEETVKRNPGNAIARAAMATVLQAKGFPERALQEIRIAKRLSPRDLGMSMFLYREASIYQTLGRFQEAVASADRALAFAPSNIDAEFIRVISLYALGRRDQAADIVASLKAAELADFHISSQWERELPEAIAKTITLNKSESKTLTYDQGLQFIFNELGW